MILLLTAGLLSTSLMLHPVLAQNTQLYENPQIGLRLLYPSDWSIGVMDEPTSDFPVTSIPFEPRDKTATIAIHVSPKRSLTIEDIVANDIQFLSRAMEIQGPGSIAVNGEEAYGYSIVGPQTNVAGKQLQFHDTRLYFDVQNTIYQFFLSAMSEENYSRALPIFENMVKSAELTGIPQVQESSFGQNEEDGESQPLNPFEPQGSGNINE